MGTYLASKPDQWLLKSNPLRRGLKTGREWQPVRATLRTLAILRALNIRNGATILELARATRISRPSLYRMLETLRDAGYVSADLARRRYCLTVLVRALSEGFNDEDWITQVARPILTRLQRDVIWPTDLGTFMDGGMWIRETTRRASPLTIDRGVAGMRLPMLSTATGRAYLAFCPSDERIQILRNLRSSPEPGNEILRRPKTVDALLERVRACGYGFRYGDPPKESGAIAVPILGSGRVLGCVNMTFMARTLTPEKAASQHLGRMIAAAERIAAEAQETIRFPGSMHCAPSRL